MKKFTKLIAILTVIMLLTGLLAVAIADDRIYTSDVFSVPEDRIDPQMLEEALQLKQDQQPEETELPAQEPDAEPEETETVEEEMAEELTADNSVEPQVLIFSSRKETVIRNELITLSSKLIGFDGVEVHYQWQVDRGDGNGWVDVEGATGATHEFRATEETILYSWRLTISVDE